MTPVWLTLVWMTLVGAAIGVVVSMFVAGRRQTGMPITIFLGSASYFLGALSEVVLGAPPLTQWSIAIVLSAPSITLYLIYRTRKDMRLQKTRGSQLPQSPE